MSTEKVDQAIRDGCKELVLDLPTLKEISKRFLNDVNKGLKKETHPTAIVKCFVTFVQDLPNGSGSNSK
jgi:hexokinase